MTQKSPISKIPMKHPRSTNLDTTHRHLRDLTYIHTKSVERPHILGHALTKTSKPTILGGHTLSNRSETSRPGSHSHTQFRDPPPSDIHSQTLWSSHPWMGTDGHIGTSQPVTLCLFPIAVLINHCNLSVGNKHKFIYNMTFA